MKLSRRRLIELAMLTAKLHQMLKKHGDKRVSYDVNTFSRAVLRHVLKLGTEHPNYEGICLSSKEAVERFLNQTAQVIFGDGNQSVSLAINGLDLVVIHGVLRLGADHAGFQGIAARSKEVVQSFRDFCKNVWIDQGLSQYEANLLDRLRHAAQG